MGKYSKSPSPSKNLTRQKPLPSIGTPIVFNRDGTLCLEDIFVQSYASPDNEIRFPRPIERVEIFEKQKSVHFDNFVKIRSIDNTAVLKGRPVDPRRARPAGDTYRHKQPQPLTRPRHVDRPRAADRGRRIQTLSNRKPPPAAAPKERTVTSAPLTDREDAERRLQEQVPPLKINTLMGKDKPPDKDNDSVITVEPRDTPTAETVSPVRETPSVTIETPASTGTPDVIRETPKTDTETLTGHVTKTPTGKRAAGADTGSQQEDQRSTDRSSNLPPDDHGPVEIPSAQLDETASMSDKNSTAGDKDFNYYASIGKKPEQSQKEVPPLNLSPEHTQKSKATKMYEELHLMSVSPSDKLPPVDTHHSSTVSVDKPKKRREVTIVDPPEKRKNTEIFAQDREYEYSHGEYKSDRKEFESMTNDERVDYFITEMHVKPEQIRELTFHPKVNEPKVIHNTYTGMRRDWTAPTSDRRGKSGRRQKPRTLVYKKVHTMAPHQRKSYMLSKLSGAVYRHINNVYGQSPKQTREKHFYERLARIQLEEYRQRYETLEEKEKKRLESLFRQREQLKQLRKRFEDDSWKRFLTQYVTSKVVEAEYKDSDQYGLPNVGSSDLPIQPRLKKRELTMDPSRKHATNRKKFNTIFNFNTGPTDYYKSKGKPLKFEGIDSVYIDTEDEEGRPTKKRQDVSELMKEAAMLIDNAELNDKVLPVSRRTQRVQHRPSLPDRTPDRPRRLMTRPWRQSIEKEKTPRGTATTQPRPPPRTMKDLISRRFTAPKRLTRYQTSEFVKPNMDLLETKRNVEQKPQQQIHKTKEPDKKSPREQKGETIRDYKIPAPIFDMRTPRESPEPIRASPVSKTTKTVTKTTKEEITVTHTVTENNQGGGRKLSMNESLQKEFGFIEEPETLVGTARKEEADRLEAYYKSNDRPKVLVSTRRESRTSVQVHDNSRVSRSTVSLRKSPVTARSPSKASIRPQNEALHRKDSKASIYMKQETPRNVNYPNTGQSKTNIKTDDAKTNAGDNIRASRTSLQIKDMTNTYKSERFIAPSIRASRTSLQAAHKGQDKTKDTKSDAQDNITPRRASKQSLYDSKQHTPTGDKSVNGQPMSHNRSRSRSMSNERKQYTPTKEARDQAVLNGKAHTRNKSKERNQPTPAQQTGDTRSRSKERIAAADVKELLVNGEDVIKTHTRNKSKERNQPTPTRRSLDNEVSSDHERSGNRSKERKPSTALHNGLVNGDSSDTGHSRSKSKERNQPTPSKIASVYGVNINRTRSRNKSNERNESTSTQASGKQDSIDKARVGNKSRERKHSTSSKEASANEESPTQERVDKSRTRNKSRERRQSTSSKEVSVYGESIKQRPARSKSRERKQPTSRQQPLVNGISSALANNIRVSPIIINSQLSNGSNSVDRKPQANKKQTIMNGELPIINGKTSVISTERISFNTSQPSRNTREVSTSERSEQKTYKRPVNVMYRKPTEVVTPNKPSVRKADDKAKKNEQNVTLKHTEYGPGTNTKNMQNKGTFDPIKARQNRPTHGRSKGYDDKRHMTKSVVPNDYTYTNGHEDTYDTRIVRRDDYERHARGRAGRRRSTSGGRKRSRSQERKRSRSRERKRSSSQTRVRIHEKEKPSTRKAVKPASTRDTDTNVVFPDIVARKMQKEMPHASRIPVKPQVARSTRFDETVKDTAISPKPKKGRVPDTGNKWQDLVKKYVRQPSPKLGKSDDRALLDINYDTDTTESEIDIFERAKRRYELQSDDSDDE